MHRHHGRARRLSSFSGGLGCISPKITLNRLGSEPGEFRGQIECSPILRLSREVSSDGAPEDLGHMRRNCIADLKSDIMSGSVEAEGIRKCLEESRLAGSDCPVVDGMCVPASREAVKARSYRRTLSI